jgi:hypothetical protein
MGRDALIVLEGKNVLVGGDPSYTDLVIGSPNPENQLLDAQPDRSVAQLVLEIFGIPFNLGGVLGGSLPGMDIRNQDATTMIKLSLAAELLDTPPAGSTRTGGPGFGEVEIAENGIARFYIAGNDAATGLDIRYCIPTSQITTPADLVIVRGYDPPPERVLRTSFDGLKNKEFMDYKDCSEESCDESITSQYASISYDDPQLDQAYLDDIVNSYELQAFENIMGYLIDLDMPAQTEPYLPSSSPNVLVRNPNYVPGIKITFGDTTKEYIKMSASLFNASTIGGSTFSSDGTETIITGGSSSVSNSAVAGSNGSGGGSSVTAVVTTVSARGDKCTVSQTALAGSTIQLDGERFKRLSKFGVLESDFIGVVDIVFSGRKVRSMTTSPGAPSFGVKGLVKTVVSPNKELISLQQGKNWTYEVDPASEDVIVHLFSVIEDDFTAFVCETYRDPLSATGNPSSDFVTFTSDNLFTSEETLSNFNDHICNIGDALGYRVNEGRLCIVVERKRPSIDIFSPLGNALDLAQEISITYTPIVVIDLPAPIAYASTSPLTSIDGTRTIVSEGIINQADGIVDSDPTTDQDLEDSELSILQDNTNGSTIDITLPFAFGEIPDPAYPQGVRQGTECLEIARNFLALQNRVITTHSMILGPDSTPRLGDYVTLPNGEIGVINDINYSYSDASQYLITITVGPMYMSAGSFNDAKYQLQTEEVSREGMVIQDAGNGAEYTVRVEGLGEFPCLLMTLEDISVGDRVGVKIYNNPVERI